MSRSIPLLIHIAFLILVPAHAFVASAEISGTVIDSSGKPVEGASIVAVQDESDLAQKRRWLSDDPSPVVIAEATSDSKGHYTLDLDEKLSVVQLRISSPGRLTAEMRVPHDGWIGAALLRDATEKKGRVIAAGEPVAGAVVVLKGAFSTGGIQVVSDEEGLFSLPELPGAFQSISILHPDYAPFYEDRVRPRENMTIPLDPGISLSGKVVGTDGETPVSDAVVSIDGWPLGESGEDGSFTIEHAPKNWSAAKISKGSLAANITRSTAKSTTVQLRKSAAISGTVVDAGTGRGIAGVAVLLEQERSRTDARERTYTDEKGQFSFPNIPPGSYSLTTLHPSWSMRNEPATVLGSSNVTKRIETERTATARGKAVNERGERVAAATISAEPEGGEDFRGRVLALSQGSSVYSAPDGRFVVFGIEPGETVRMVGTHRAYPIAKSDPLTATSGETASGADILFPTGVSITGTVVTSAGDPVSKAEIEVSESERGRRSGPSIIRFIRSMVGDDQPVLTNAAGEFDVKVSEGQWDLTIRASGFAPKQLNAVDTRKSLDPLQVVLEEGVSVQGRVIRGGTGIPDVMVAVMSASNSEPVTTSSDGSFTINDLPRGPVALMAAKPEEMIREMRTVEAPESNLLIEVPAGGAIRGRLLDEGTGEPITDFQAGASPDRGDRQFRFGRERQPYHSDDGEFFIDNVPPGRTQIVFEAQGYVEKTVRGIEVVEGETVDSLEVEISRGVRVTGTVRDDSGTTLAGVSVRIEDGEESFFPAMSMMPGQVTTDSAGEYIIPAAPAGETTIVFSKDGYVSTRRSAELEGKEVRVDAKLSSGRSVSGTVVSHSGAPVDGARVMAQSAAQTSRGSFAETDAAGQFTLDGLADGRYTFMATHPDYVAATSEDVDISGNQPVRLVMEQGGTIVGRIIGADPSAYASIEVLARVGSSGVSRSPVSPDGTFRIETVPPGTAQIVARMGRMFDNRASETHTVEVAAGSQVSVDLEFLDGVEVSGLVSRNGEPLRSGVIRFGARDGSSTASTTIDSNGRYTIGGLQRGTYDLFIIDFQSSAPYSERVEITASSQTVDVDIRGGRILGRITDSASGQPIENATISVEPSETRQNWRSRLGATTAASGEFLIEGVPAGSYRLRVERSGYAPASRDVYASEEGDQTVDVSLQPNEGASLRVVDARDGRSLTADVSVYDAQNRPVWEGRPSPREDGTIQVPVGSGTYRIRVSAIGYATATSQISSPGPTETIRLSTGGSLVIESRGTTPVRARVIDAWGLPYRESRWNRSGEISIRPGMNHFENLAPGEYTLQIIDESGAPVRSETVSIRKGDTTLLTL